MTMSSNPHRDIVSHVDSVVLVMLVIASNKKPQISFALPREDWKALNSDERECLAEYVASYYDAVMQDPFRFSARHSRSSPT